MVLLKMPRKKFYIETFGCQMNLHDSEKISGVLHEEGYCASDNQNDSDLIIFNTCSIREKAEQKFFSELGRVKLLKKKNPNLRIAVAGCIAQHHGRKILRRAPYVDFVFGPQNIHLLTQLIEGDVSAVADHENPDIAEMDIPVARRGEGRAWVSIMYGCNNFCSYCIVPYTRGRERSRPSDSIILEIRGLGDKGFKEVTLLGQNVNSYDSDVSFPQLLRKVDAIASIERVRFVTSHPRDLSEELIEAMSELEKVCEHLHLPLQSASDRILKQMNRGYRYEDYRVKLCRLREKVRGMAITTDIITGFPGETEEDHRATVRALEECEFDGIFAFKFSPREGTRAAKMECQIADPVSSTRLHEILELQDSITLKKNRKLENTLQEILVEGQSETDAGMLTGRTRSNKVVNFRGDDALKGRLISVRIAEGRKHSLMGELE